jgi:hypothetical protein
MKNEKIVCSFSSGLSSAMMAKILLDKYSKDNEIVFIMANTGREDNRSLEFADKCDKYFGLNLVWVEGDITQEKGVGTKHIVKTFETLNRDGYVFEEGIKKYGLPNVSNKWCNRDLKLAPIHSYIKNELKWKDYWTAIGIRADEIDRISVDRVEKKLWYPLAEMGITKKDRNRFWKDMPFSIEIKGYEGNCTMCFEKTMRKLATMHKGNPMLIDWWKEMEEKYGKIKIDGKDNYNSQIDKFGSVNFLRQNKSYDEVIEMSKRPFQRASDEYIYENDLWDQAGSCDSGCNFY